jgi:hypothetical protein
MVARAQPQPVHGDGRPDSSAATAGGTTPSASIGVHPSLRSHCDPQPVHMNTGAGSALPSTGLSSSVRIHAQSD